jgi:hypothetical protein
MSVALKPVVASIYLKFINCCDETEILFTGSISGIINGGVYNYQGATPFPGWGGTLTIDGCYTVTQLTMSGVSPYPAAPSQIYLSYTAGGCSDSKCAPCSEPLPCECPDEYTLVGLECVKTIEIPATYTGGLFQIDAGDKNPAYNQYGIRLYSDISTYTVPIIGDSLTGNNAGYTVKDNNGTGVLIPQLSNTVSKLWGNTIPGCVVGSTTGRLNVAGIWTSGNYPGLTDLCFDFCVNPTETKQYLIGISGDNSVSLSIDSVLTVNLKFGNGSGGITVPFTSWHVFPITLTAGLHTITLCGQNAAWTGNPSAAAFGGEIYDIDLVTFQSTLLNPAIAAGNCGNIPGDLSPYILFSTANMIGLSVPDPNDPGVWECPEGYVLDECQGAPVCTIEDKFLLTCPCYLLAPCDGSDTFVSFTTDLSNYINQFVNVSYGLFTGCVYVIELNVTSCDNSVDVIIDDLIVCDCLPYCYYIQNGQGILYVEYIDGSDVLQQITPAQSLNETLICSKIPPIIQNPNLDYTVTQVGECVDGACPDKCFLLTDCSDPTNILHSTSISLLNAAVNGLVINIAGYTECWIVELLPDGSICDCPIDVIITTVSANCADCITVINYKLTDCTNPNTIVYTTDDLSAYVGEVIRREDCPGCYIVEVLIGAIPLDPVSIIVSASYVNCIECERTYYMLTDCSGIEESIITYSDLIDYVAKVITLSWCPGTCWRVSTTDESSNAGISFPENVFDTCEECITTASCICTTIKNYDPFTKTYEYLDCFGEIQSITLASGAKSERMCLIKWLIPTECNCIVVTTVTNGITSYGEAFTTELIYNDKPTYIYELTKSIYFDGSNWILTGLDSITPEYYIVDNITECPEGTWHPVSSIPVADAITISTLACQNTIEYFGDCINGVCPPKVYPKRSLKPGYNTPACSAEKYEKISCRSSQILYRNVLSLRYGITNCCPEDDEYWLIKKELIDLAALYNPDYVCAAPSCGCKCNCGCEQANDCSCNLPKTCNS